MKRAILQQSWKIGVVLGFFLIIFAIYGGDIWAQNGLDREFFQERYYERSQSFQHEEFEGLGHGLDDDYDIDYLHESGRSIAESEELDDSTPDLDAEIDHLQRREELRKERRERFYRQYHHY